MLRGEAEIAIKASVERVWEKVSDLEKLVGLVPETKGFRYTSQERKGLGTSWSCIEEMVAGVVDTEGTVTEWQERERISARVSTLRRGGRRPSKGSWTLSMSPSSNGTKLTYVFRVDGTPGLLFWPLLPLMNMSLTRVAKRTAKKVKEAVEAEVKR